MKVAFVCAEDESLGVEYLSSYLKRNGHQTYLVFDPKQFDRAYIRNQFLAKMFSRAKEDLNRLEAIKPDLIGFSCTTAHYQWAINFAKKVKQRLPGIPIIFGGVHSTLVPELVIKEECVNFVCVGEGEEPLRDLLQALEKGNNQYRISNIWYKKDGRVETNPLRPLLNNLDELPYMDKELFYGSVPRHYREYSYFSTGRGCPFTCSFCGNEQMKRIFMGLGRYIRRMSPRRTIDELVILKGKYGARHILFEDDVFTVDSSWLKEFIPIYKARVGLPFTCFGHPQFLTAETIALLKQGGCKLLWWGIQSASEEIRRKAFNRTETNAQIIKAANLCHRAGIKFMIDHILNIPYDTEAAIREAVALYNKIRPGIVNCYRLLYFPKSKIVDIAIGAGTLRQEEVDLINQGKSVVYQTGVLSSKENDFYRKYALLLTLIPFLPKVWVVRIQRSSRLIKFVGRLPLFLIPFIKIFLNWRIGHGFLPLAIFKMELFFTQQLLCQKVRTVFKSN